MERSYFSYLDYRESRRRLLKRLLGPLGVALHTFLFVLLVSIFWIGGWPGAVAYFQSNYAPYVVFGAAWAALLALHAIISLVGSGARPAAREEAVEAEMRRLIAAQPDYEDIRQADLFAMHRQLEADVLWRDRWHFPLTFFALANLVSWGLSALDRFSSWPYQMTLPLALVSLGLGALLTRLAAPNRQPQRWLNAAAWVMGIGGLLVFIYPLTNPDMLYPFRNAYGIDIWLYWGALLLANLVPLLASLRGRPAPRLLMDANPTPVAVEKAKRAGDVLHTPDGGTLDIIEDEAAARFQRR